MNPIGAKLGSQLKLIDEANQRLKKHLNFQAVGYECTTEMVLDVLIRAAINRQTIETVCHTLTGVIDGETIRGYFNQQIQVEGLPHLEQQRNQILVVGLPRRLWKVPLEIAIDLHDEPFYRHSPELVALTCGGEAHKGTSRFFRVATAYVIFKDMCLTLALLFVRSEDELAELVAALLRRLRILGFRIRRLYLDKGFCSIPMMRSIAQSGWAAILSCPIRGNKGGTRGLWQGKTSYLTNTPSKVRLTAAVVLYK